MNQPHHTSLAKASCRLAVAVARALSSYFFPRAEGGIEEEPHLHSSARMWAPGSPGRLPALEECDEDDAAEAADLQDARLGSTSTTMMASCWGRFGAAALWRRLRQHLILARRRRRRGRSSQLLGAGAGGGLNYDPLSYAQNFDDGCGGLEELEPADFSARFAPARHAPAADGSPLPTAAVRDVAAAS